MKMETASIAEIKDCYKYSAFIASAGIVYGTKIGPLSLTLGLLQPF